jgi:hypothetical protein
MWIVFSQGVKGFSGVDVAHAERWNPWRQVVEVCPEDAAIVKVLSAEVLFVEDKRLHTT